MCRLMGLARGEGLVPGDVWPHNDQHFKNPGENSRAMSVGVCGLKVNYIMVCIENMDTKTCNNSQIGLLGAMRACR